MRKEVAFAIIAGIVFGVIIAFGVWRANSAMTQTNSAASTSNSDDNSSDTTVITNQTLTLVEPENYDVVIEDTVTVSGMTKPNAYIVISDGEEVDLAIANSSGSFEKEVELSAGVNALSITSLTETGTIETQNMTLIYSSEFAKAD